ncbi:MAG: KGK domain-containing protein [Leptolyngbyaceae cyanobacterium]
MEKLELLDDNEVISDISQSLLEELYLPQTAKVYELVEALFYTLSEVNMNLVMDQFSCSVLRYNQNDWTKGKLKICLAFIPDDDSDKTDESSENLSSTNISPPEKIRQNSSGK